MNERVRVVGVETLSDDWAVLRKTTFDWRRADGTWRREARETYDRGDGATILLHDPAAATVLLIRQFRLPAFVNGHPDGMLIEAPAGLLDAEAAIRREAEEETGVRVGIGEGGGLAHDGEDIEVLELPFDEARAMIERGEIADGKTILLLQWARLEGLC